MADDNTILVCGATGKQGGAVARHLLKAGFAVRALTRDPDKPSAARLREAGAEVVQGDLDDEDSLVQAADGVYGIFSVQNFWETGYDREVEQGEHIADAADEAGVEHFVYSSVGSADEDTGIPHFDSKNEVEEYVRSADLPYTILRPVWFMNNWEGEQFKQMISGGMLAQPLSPDTVFQQISVDDIGAFATLAFQNPEAWVGREVDIAGDGRTMSEIAEAFTRVTGREVTYHQVPWDDFRSQAGDEYADMYRWFEDVGYKSDIDALREEYSGLTNFEEYLVARGWKDLAAQEKTTAQ